MSTPDTCWFHAESAESEYGSRPFDTRDEAIADATTNYEPGQTYALMKGERVTEDELARWLARLVRFHHSDGDFEEDAEIGTEDPVFEMTKADEEALVPILAAWARERKVLRTWYRWGTSESMTVPEDHR